MTSYFTVPVEVQAYCFKHFDKERPEWLSGLTQLINDQCWVYTNAKWELCDENMWIVRHEDETLEVFREDDFYNLFRKIDSEKFVPSGEIDRCRLNLVQEADNGFVSIQSVIKELCDLVRLFGV